MIESKSLADALAPVTLKARFWIMTSFTEVELLSDQTSFFIKRDGILSISNEPAKGFNCFTITLETMVDGRTATYRLGYGTLSRAMEARDSIHDLIINRDQYFNQWCLEKDRELKAKEVGVKVGTPFVVEVPKDKPSIQ